MTTIETTWQRLSQAARRAVRPPDLQTGEDRTASRLELFFDLAFVLVVAELATSLREDVSPRGLLTFVGLFTTVWWAWVSTTLYANRFDHDDVVYRLGKLGGMAAVIGLAASATAATGERFAVFVGCQLVFRAVLALQYVRAFRHVASARPVTRLYLLGTVIGSGAWAVSLLVPRPAGVALWAAAILRCLVGSEMCIRDSPMTAAIPPSLPSRYTTSSWSKRLA